MGKGKGPCTRVGGYENPAVAAWSLSAALLAVISVSLLLLSEASQLKDSLTNGLQPDQYGDIRFVSRSTFLILGFIHLFLFVASCAVTLCGYFLCSKLLCLACPVVLLSELTCLITSGFGGYMLGCIYSYRNEAMNVLRYDTASPKVDFSITFVNNHSGLILLVSVCCLACLAPLSRAGTIDEDGTMVDVMLHLPVITGCMCISGLLIFLSRSSLYLFLGAAWLVAALLAGILIGLQKMRGLTSRVSTLIISVFYFVVLILSLACVIIAGSDFVGGRQQVINYVRTDAALRPNYFKNIKEEDFITYKNYYINNQGGVYLSVVVVAAVVLIYSFMGAAFSIRAVVGGSSALTRDIEEEEKN